MQAVEHRQRVLVGRRGVQLAGGVDGILRGRGAGHAGGHENDKSRDSRTHYFFLISTLRRACVVAVTLTAWRCSPRSGCRNTTSCDPMGTDRLPIGVSPTFSPSIHTSAHGIAFNAIVPFGHSTLTAATLPA